MIIATWGANGSGKTSLTAQLGCEIAKDKFTLVIGGALTHSSLQHHFGLSENEKTLQNVLQNPDNVRENVCNYSKRKDLYILDLGAKDDCLQQADALDKQAEKLLDVADGIFDIVIVDCSVNYNNPLTRAALLQSKIVIHLFQPTLEGISYTLSHKVLIDRLGLDHKTRYVLNQDQKMIEYFNLKRLIGKDFSVKLPFCSNILKSSVSGVPININGASCREDSRYLSSLTLLAKQLLTNI